MRDWFAQAFGRTADAIGDAIGDVRDKVILEGWTGRKFPERDAGNDLGWFQNQPSAPQPAEGSALDQFYDRLSPAERAEFFCEPPEQDHGIER